VALDVAVLQHNLHAVHVVGAVAGGRFHDRLEAAGMSGLAEYTPGGGGSCS
jgi:hypothetical protein